MSTRRRSALHARLVVQIRHMIAASILFNQKIADRVGLRLVDMQCMNILDLLGPVTPGELARFTGLTTGGVTVMLDRLEASGYVKREPSPTDRRSVLVRVNPKKLKRMNVFYEEMNRGIEALFASTPESELTAAERLLSRMSRAEFPVRLNPTSRAKRAPA